MTSLFCNCTLVLPQKYLQPLIQLTIHRLINCSPIEVTVPIMVLLRRQTTKASDPWDIAMGLEDVSFPFWLGKKIANMLCSCEKGNIHLQFSFRAKLTHLSPTVATPVYLLHRTTSRRQRKFKVGLQVVAQHVGTSQKWIRATLQHIPGWLKAVEREQFSTEWWTWHCLRWEYTQVTGQLPTRKRTGRLDQVILEEGHVAEPIRVGTECEDASITHSCPPESTWPPQKRHQITK